MTARRTQTLVIALALVTLVLTPPSDDATATVAPSEDLPVHGPHLVTFFWIDDPAGHATTVLAAEDPDGTLILKADVNMRRIHVSDGSNDSAERPTIEVPLPITSSWNRVDILLQGDTYSISVDQKASVEGRTFVPATAGAWIDDPRHLDDDGMIEEVVWADQRVDGGDGTYEHTFTTSLAEGHWRSHEDGGEVDELRNATGYRSAGSAEILGAITPGLAYIHAPVDAFAGRFGADVSARPHQNLFGGPIGQTFLAGLSGPIENPTIGWAFLIDRPAGTLDAWAVFYQAPDGIRTQVGPTMDSPAWSSYRFTIDETGDRITLRIEGGDAVTLSDQDLGTSDRVGIGDLDPAIGLDHGAGVMRVDDVALYPLD